MLLSRYLLPSTISPLLILSVAAADILFARISATSARAFQAFQRLGHFAQLQVLFYLSKLIAALGLGLLTDSPTPQQWGLLYLLSAILSASVAFLVTHR